MSIKQHRMITFLGWGGLRLKSVCAGTRTSFFFFSFSLKPWRSFLYIYSYFLSFFLLSPAYKNAESTLPSDLSRRLCVWDFWWLTCCCYCCLFLVETESFRATTTPHSWITFLCFLKIQSFETDILISKFYFHLYFICLFFFFCQSYLGAEGKFQLWTVLSTVKWTCWQISGRRTSAVRLSIQRTWRLSRGIST